MRYYTVLLFLVSIFSSTKSYGIEPQHQVAHSYGGTRVYAHDSVIISPNAAINLYSQTTTGLSTDTTNAPRKDALCRSVVNTSDNDYFVPWRSALQSNASKNEWTRFIQAASTGTVPGLSVYSCCYPRINPNKPCNVVYPLGKRKAGALPSKTPAATDPSVEVENYAAQGDVSYDVVGFNRKESWVCDAGEWVYSSNEGGCFQDGKCNKYDAATNPSGFDGASINAIPSSTADRANFMCNGVSPVAFGTSTFPNPNNIATPPPYGTAGWTWKCPGQSGGTSEFCQASYNGNPMKGVCGYAQGRTYAAAPTSNVRCYIGTPTEVSGPTILPNSKWTWSCDGVNGGSSAGCYAPLPVPINASCGAYSSASKSTGLLSFETVNGNPDPTKLCTNSVLYNNAILGNGSLATPWQWQCFRSENSSIANCQNTYTKTGKCGAVNGTSLTTAPSVSASMCTQGRWYNKATTGLVANASIWNAEAKTWTWACLGHNPTTLTMSNDLCSAKKCAECTGATESDAIKPFSGTYDDCSFDSNNAQLIFRQVIKHQTNSSDVSALISFGSGGHGMLTLPTTIAKGYCSPCYDKTIGIISSKVQIDSSCVLSPPRGYSASVLLQ